MLHPSAQPPSVLPCLVQQALFLQSLMPSCHLRLMCAGLNSAPAPAPALSTQHQAGLGDMATAAAQAPAQATSARVRAQLTTLAEQQPGPAPNALPAAPSAQRPTAPAPAGQGEPMQPSPSQADVHCQQVQAQPGSLAGARNARLPVSPPKSLPGRPNALNKPPQAVV